MITCPNCQNQVQEDKKFCPHCGFKMPEPARDTVPELSANDTAVDLTAANTAVESTQTAAAPTTPLSDYALPPQIEDRSPKGPVEDDAVPMEEAFAFEPLGEQAVAGNDYLITHEIKAVPELNIYHVQDMNTHIPYILKESSDWQHLSPEIDLIDLALPEEGLSPPVVAFLQRLGGAARYYVVLPQPAYPLVNVPIPVEVPKALSWGVGLANGLAALHAHGIAFGTIDKTHVVLDGDQLLLADFEGSLMDAPAAALSEDVRQLAVVLYEMMTGTTEYSPTTDLPGELKGVFAQIMNNIQPVSAADFASALSEGLEDIRHPDSIDLRVGRKTDVGMLRQLNEDSLYTADTVWINQSVSRPIGVFVVADGMGGHEGGEVASGLTIDMIGRLTAREFLGPAAGGGPMPNVDDWLKATVQEANIAVFERGQESHNDMGTTVVMAVMIGSDAHLAHVGDSRAYHITKDAIETITTDHSLVESLVASGQITREEARHHPQSNVIYRTIGDKREVEVDLTHAQIGAGEYLLLCSDGLNGMVTDDRIHQIVVSADSPQEACEALISAANAAGGDDNITVILVQPEALS